MRITFYPVLVLALSLGACSSIKQSLGLERAGPDEFTVVERAPLTMPPNFDLVPPRPGTQRPQEKTADAKGLVLGNRDNSAQPATGSASERALLNQAGAANKANAK